MCNTFFINFYPFIIYMYIFFKSNICNTYIALTNSYNILFDRTYLISSDKQIKSTK